VIASLTGTLAAASADWAVIDVGGVGYRVLASTRTLTALGPVGGAVTLHTEMQVREDAISLIGFTSADERDWFGILLAIQGVGAKVALAVLSVLPPADLARAIAAKDPAMVAQANGVGPKLAARIVNELKDRVPAFGPAATPIAPPRGTSAADALSALGNLGFRPAEAARAVAVAETELGNDAAVDALIAAALRRSAR